MRMILAFLFFAAMPAAAQPAPSAGAQHTCAPVPRLMLEEGFVDPRSAFGPNSEGMRSTSANFELAYRRACGGGWLRSPDLRRDVVRLRNSPNANVASIFPVSLNRRRGTEGLVLEFPFVADDGTVEVPSAEEIHEAIYCRATSASTSEREDGRCLPD